ncbi:MAG: hypothetical protein CVV45_01460 [Spirochaetae bacterium HGW-Spirochaetae-10]|nr:MAG: hypothetical protein CVV45_01460 [Spirochaetae bacterium HGW-Spirochaetae-10]
MSSLRSGVRIAKQFSSAHFHLRTQNSAASCDLMASSDANRYFGSGRALGIIRDILDDARLVRIATAFFEPSGWQLLEQTLRDKEVRLLIGRPEGTPDRIRSIAEEFAAALFSGDLEHRTRSIAALRDALQNGRFSISAGGGTLDPRHILHHAKIYISDDIRAVVASSNFTFSGLLTAREAGIVVRDEDDVAYFIDRFDEYFEQAIPLGEELLDLLDRWLRLGSAYHVYLKALLAVYGLPESEEVGRLPALAGYQRPVVSRILRNVEDFGGSFVVASTGLGKTIMTAHAAAMLRAAGMIDSALVFCPAGLRQMWRRTLRAGRVSSEEFSYSELSITDWRRSRRMDVLLRELDQVDERTLLILDESHHLRNEESGGELRLRNSRIEEAVSKGARTLLVTATPYSRGVDDINAQLRLLPKQDRQGLFANHSAWHLETPAELSDLNCSVVLTAPIVVRHFSEQDEAGERYVIFSGDRRMYFPRRIHIRSHIYENALDAPLSELLKSGLLRRRIASEETAPDLFGNGPSGKRDALTEARIIHQFCSSSAEASRVLGQLGEEGGFDTLRFQRQEELSVFAREARRIPESMLADQGQDPKIRALCDILRSHPAQKAVIFCTYVSTALFVRAALNSLLPDLKVDCTVDRDADDLDRLLRAFAPISNSAEFLEDDTTQDETLDVLVATGSLAEGFNLQDAPLLINFDLPWTVLVLAQRMGRILRPWHEPREIHIYNLIPSTMERLDTDDLYLARKWKERLERRSKEHRSFADIPVLLEEREGSVEMIALARVLRQTGDPDLNLDEALAFVESVEEIRTSSFLDDLGRASEADLSAVRSMVPGLRSIKGDESTEGLFVLFSYRDRPCPVLFDMQGAILLDTVKADEIMARIRCEPDTGETQGIPQRKLEDTLDRYDRLLQRSRDAWAHSRDIDPEELRIVCSMLLRS